MHSGENVEEHFQIVSDSELADLDMDEVDAMQGPSDDNEERRKRRREPSVNYEVRMSRERVFANGIASERTFYLTFQAEDDALHPSAVEKGLLDAFNDVIAQAKVGESKTARVRVIIDHPSLKQNAVIALKLFKDVEGVHILNLVESLCQSGVDLDVGDNLKVIVGVIRPRQQVVGSNILGLSLTDQQDASILRHPFTTYIHNRDNNCIARALAMAFGKLFLSSQEEFRRKSQHVTKGETWDKVFQARCCPEWFFKEMRDSKKNPHQGNLAKVLSDAAQVPYDVAHTLDVLDQFEEALDLSIYVIEHQTNIVKRPGNRHGKLCVFLLYIPHSLPDGVGHVHLVHSISGFFKKKLFLCEACGELVPSFKVHKCPEGGINLKRKEDVRRSTACWVCKRKKGCVPVPGQKTVCPDCNFTCLSDDCFEAHKKKPTHHYKANPRCGYSVKCLQCKVILDRTPDKNPLDTHDCGHRKCNHCQRRLSEDLHVCYHRTAKKKDPVDKFVFFDVETRQDETYECAEGYSSICDPCRHDRPGCAMCRLCRHCLDSKCGQYIHKPVMIVTYTACTKCMDDPVHVNASCERCGHRCGHCNKLNAKMEYKSRPCTMNCARRERVFVGES